MTLEANKIEQMLKYRKASFPKSVSTAFVAHFREILVFKTKKNVCAMGTRPVYVICDPAHLLKTAFGGIGVKTVLVFS